MSTYTFLLILIGAIYLISPVDLIPEVLSGLFGFIDDALLLGFLYWQYSKKLKSYKEQLNFYREKLSSQKVASQSSSSDESGKKASFDPYEVLEIEHGASRDEIESAYKKQISLYHPDKVSHLGEELKKLAHQKTLDIQKAYEMLK